MSLPAIEGGFRSLLAIVRRGCLVTRTAFLVALALFSTLMLQATHTVAATENVLDQVSQIFDAVDGQPGAKATRGEARERLQELKPSSTAAPAAQYAYLLGLVALKEYRDAAAYSDEVLRRSPKDVRFRLMRARLLLREKKFPQVLTDMDVAGKSLAGRPKPTTLNPETEASCRDLGLMVGYLEGPAKPLVKATLGRTIKTRLLADLTPAGKQAFDEQYALVQEEYETLTKKGEAALRELQAKHLENAKKLADRRTKIEQDKSETKQQATTAASELAREWDRVKAEYDVVAKSYLDLGSKQTQLAAQRMLLAAQAFAAKPIEPRNSKFRDSDEREEFDKQMQNYQQLVTQVNAADLLMLQGSAELKRLWTQGMVVQANLLQLQQQGNRLGLQLALKEKAFAQQDAQLKRIETTEKPPRSASVSSYQSFALYDDFNYPAEKQRLLDSLEQAK